MKPGDEHGEDAQKTSPFDAAKLIAENLAQFAKPEQERILRWVAEQLGIQSSGTQPGPQVSEVHPAPQVPGRPPPRAPVTQPLKDIRTFVLEKRPKSDIQYAAVVAYYFRFEAPPDQRRDTIGAGVLEESARQVGRKRFSRARKVLADAMSRGYLDREDLGEYRINTVGENLVAMTLPGGSEDNASRSQSPARKRKTSPKPVRNAVRRTRKPRAK